MKKHIIKFFTFGLVLFSCIFFINNCKAVSADDVYDFYEQAIENNYFGVVPSNNITVNTNYSFLNISREFFKQYCDDSLISEFSNFMVVGSWNTNDYCNIDFYFYNKSYVKLLYSDKNVCFADISSDDKIFCVSFKCNPSGSFYYYSSRNINNSTDYFFSSNSAKKYLRVFVNCGYNNGPFSIFTNSRLSSCKSTSVEQATTYKNLEDEFNKFTFIDLPYYQYNNSIIGDKDSNIKINYEYNENFSSCHINATIVNGEFSDKLFYSLQLPGISGNGLNIGKKEFDSINGIDINYNCSIFFQAENYKGDIIDTNSIYIDSINSLNSDDFNIIFYTDTEQKTFICKFSDISLNPYYDIFLKVDGWSSDCQINFAGNIIVEDELRKVDLSSDFIKINLGQLYSFDSVLPHDLVFNFKVVNKKSSKTVITKVYNVKLSGLYSPGEITGGTVIDSNNNSFDLNTSNDSNVARSNNMFSSINSDSSISDIMSTVQDTFNSFSMFFNIFPPFIWGIIGSGIIVLIVLRVLGR